MIKTKTKIKIAILIVFLVAIIFSINAIISKVITKKINELVLNNSFKLHTAKVENVKFNLFQRSVIATNLFLTPTEESLSKLKGQSLKNKKLDKISISSIKFKGIHLLKILFDNDIKINELIVNDLLFQDFINTKIKDKPNQKKPLNLDSISIQKIKGLQIGKIKFNNFNFQQIDINSKELLFHHEPFDFRIDGVVLKNVGDQVFKLMPLKNVFEIHDVEIKLPKKGYNLQIASIKLDFNKAIFAIEKFKYKPLTDKNTLANSYKFSKAVFDTEIDKIFIYNFQIKKAIKKEGVFIDSIEIIDLKLDVFKDKRRPFDETLRPKDPHVLLK